MLAQSAAPVINRPAQVRLTGRHFVKVDSHDQLASAVDSLAGEVLLAIQYLDARGADGMSRKYCVMIIDGVLYPLHLAISADWKVHYFTADMAHNAAFREEERRFLNDMSALLGAGAMRALEGVCEALGLEYAGIDFVLAPTARCCCSRPTLRWWCSLPVRKQFGIIAGRRSRP